MTGSNKSFFEIFATAALLFLSACASTPVNHNTQQATLADQFPSVTPHALPGSTCRAPDYHTLDAIVRVATMEVGGGDASGIVIARNVVLTAAHVLEGSDEGLVYIGKSYKRAVVLGEDPYTDLALLAVGTENLLPISLSQATLEARESVWAVGYPLAQQRTTTQGEFFNYRNGGLLTSAEIDAGSSGGGLFRCINGEFRLAGMVQSYLAYFRGDQAVKFPKRSISVPADTIQAFMTIHGIDL